jgi:hypothetical protein
MHAVVVDVTVQDFEPALESLKERVVPMVSQSPGFVSGVWLAPSEGKGHSVAVFQSEEDAQRMVDGLRANPENPAVTIDRVEIREVVASA